MSERDLLEANKARDEKQFQEMNEAKEMFEKEKRKLQNEMKRREDEKDKLGPIL